MFSEASRDLFNLQSILRFQFAKSNTQASQLFMAFISPSAVMCNISAKQS